MELLSKEISRGLAGNWMPGSAIHFQGLQFHDYQIRDRQYTFNFGVAKRKKASWRLASWVTAFAVHAILSTASTSFEGVLISVIPATKPKQPFRFYDF